MTQCTQCNKSSVNSILYYCNTSSKPMSQCRCCYACALLTAVAFAALAVADATMPVVPSPPHHTAKRTAGARGSHVRAGVPSPQLVPQVVPHFVLSHADTAEGFQIASVLLRRLNSVPPTSVGVPLVAGVTDLKSPYARLLERRGAKVNDPFLPYVGPRFCYISGFNSPQNENKGSNTIRFDPPPPH